MYLRQFSSSNPLLQSGDPSQTYLLKKLPFYFQELFFLKNRETRLWLKKDKVKIPVNTFSWLTRKLFSWAFVNSWFNWTFGEISRWIFWIGSFWSFSTFRNITEIQNNCTSRSCNGKKWEKCFNKYFSKSSSQLDLDWTINF